jgi:hypothetical protein
LRSLFQFIEKPKAAKVKGKIWAFLGEPRILWIGIVVLNGTKRLFLNSHPALMRKSKLADAV